MTPKEALEGIKQAIAEHLHKQTGVSVEKHFEYLQSDTDIEIITNALKELERLKKFKETFDNYELAKKQDFIAYENWLECEKELEALKTPPTVNEVIKALSEQLKSTIITRKNKHGITFNYAQTKKTIISTNYDLLNIKVQLPPHLITMIGKFYESLEGEKNE